MPSGAGESISFVRCQMKTIANPLRPGDVIRTHPQSGYWGCAVVLSARDSTPEFHPMCHIGTTTLIRKRKYSWNSVDPVDLKIAQLGFDVRIAPNEYVRAPKERICICIYSLRSANGLDIIGHVDPMQIYPHQLTFDVGDGTSGKFPLCGPIPNNLGHEAVVVWRRENDSARFEQESRKSREQFEFFEAQRLAKARAARKARSGT